jgi:O-antigen/teichoic acid export membrane protein
MASGLIFGVNAALNLVLTLALARLLSATSYGALATWTAAALFVATAAFDWVRFSAMRFYTPASRAGEPAVRATLDISFLGCVPLAGLAVFALAGAGVLPGLDWIGALALAAFLIGNAASEYLAALARNVGATGAYARLVAIRHLLTLGAALPVAAWTQDPRATMIALGLAVWPSVLFGALALRDRQAAANLASGERALGFARYGTPQIAAEAVFQAIGLVNRLWLASQVDLAAAGIYALTADLAFKVLAVMASVTEAALMPRLVARAAATAGAAREVRPELKRLVAAMLIVTAASAAAFWILSPLVSRLLLGPSFQTGFLGAIGIALGAATLYVVQTYMLRPIFQLDLRTSPLLHSALLALVVNVAALPFLAGRGVEGVMLAHLMGLGAGAALLLARAVLGWRRS